MRHIREILRLKWRLSHSHRETARSLGISAGVVASVLSRASKLGLTWDALEELTDDALERTSKDWLTSLDDFRNWLISAA